MAENDPASLPPSDTPAPRMAPLAKLPIFLNLEGRKVVLAGGGAPAVWKAELIAATGAHLQVFAPEPCAEMEALAAAGGLGPGRIEIIRRAHAPEDLAGAALALAETEEDEPAAAFAAAARARGIPVNVIDRPAFCDFQFGSIVNRSPVIVAIATDGAAPILAQAIRQKVEAMLPAALGQWSAAAKAFRDRLKARFGRAADRRRFWEAFAAQALAGRTGPGPGALEALADGVEVGGSTGSVALVGAGPGDPGLLTLAAVQALQSADVVLYDRLVSDAVLELARREARRVLVGKRGGKLSCRQEEINTLMVTLAREGKRVVRLKSGDPGLFGRAAEEAEHCRAHGVAVSFIPGVSAAFAAAAALGTSLSHRELARRVQFVTGHGRDGALPTTLDWQALADPGATTALYMGVRTLTPYLDRAVAAGLPADTPAVAVENAGTAQQRVIVGTATTLPARLAAAAPEGPTVVLMGAAFRTAAEAEPAAA